MAILGELLGTNLLKASNGFSSLWETIGSLAAYGACFYFLALAMKTVNLNVAYALWAGLGIVLTSIVAVVLWKEPINLASILGIGLILGGVVILNLYGASINRDDFRQKDLGENRNEDWCHWRKWEARKTDNLMVLEQGHEVTALVCSPDKLRIHNLPFLKRDILQITRADIQPFSAVINAFGAPVGHEALYINSTQHLLHVFKELPTRLIVVGGSGSLYADKTDQQQLIDLVPAGQLPPEILATGKAAAKAFNLIKAHQDVQWTSATPPNFFDAHGTFTGHYQLGTDYLLEHAAGESYISYDDFVLAIIEELKKQQFIQQRFTAIGDRI